jgi:cation transport ATPase
VTDTRRKPAARDASIAVRIAGLLLILDGLLLALLGMIVILVFRPVGAVQGREYVDQTPYWLLVVPILLGVAYLWAGQRALRGIHAGRQVGILLATVPAVLFGALFFNPSMNPGELAFAAGAVIAQVFVIVVLVRWRPGDGEPPRPAERASGVAPGR